MSTEDWMTPFLDLSSALTGVLTLSLKRPQKPGDVGQVSRPGDLRPGNTPINLAEKYLDLLMTTPLEVKDGDQLVTVDFTELLKEFKEQVARAQPNADPVHRPASEIAAEFIFDHKTYGPVARSVIKLWSLGVWYAPNKPREPVRVISSQAYKEGLVWKIMQAHPQGYSNYTFGYWASDPPPLTEFVTPVAS